MAGHIGLSEQKFGAFAGKRPSSNHLVDADNLVVQSKAVGQEQSCISSSSLTATAQARKSRSQDSMEPVAIGSCYSFADSHM